MPIYTYKCAKCGFEQDHRHEMTADFSCVCPKDNNLMQKKPSIPAVSFKGTGWGANG